jgi:TatA/E family protein of Tat protein translocase
MFGIGMTELMIIFAIALLVLGPTKLPQVAKSIGKGLRELRRASDDLRSAVMFDDDEPKRYRPQPPPPAAELPAHTPEPAIPGSEAAPSGTIARGSSVEEAHDPDDADDHADMPYAPGSPELEKLLADAKSKATADVQDAELNEPEQDAKESA